MTSESHTASETVAQLPNPVMDEGPSALVGQEQGSVVSPELFNTSLAALAAKLPLQLDLCIPLPSFRVQNLLTLEKGQVIESAWSHTEDLPLWSGGVHLVWTEFEVVDQKLAVRVTRLV